MTHMVDVEARSGAENGSADCLGTTGVPHEYFAHTSKETVDTFFTGLQIDHFIRKPFQLGDLARLLGDVL